MSEKKTILITGAAGFIGAHLCEYFLNSGFRIVAVDNLSFGKIENINPFIDSPFFEWFEEDISQPGKWKSQKTEVVIHAASLKIPRYDNGVATLIENVSMTTQITDYCKIHGSRLIFCSTSDVYGKQNPPFSETDDVVLGSSLIKRWNYALSKLYSEALIAGESAQHGFPYLILRLFGCYGPKHSLSWRGGPHSVFIEQALKNETFDIHGDGEQIRSFIYIDDMVKAIELAVKSNVSQEIINICSTSNEQLTINALANKINRAMNGTHAPKKYIPYSEFGKYEDVMKRWGDGQKAEKLLGFKAEISFDEGLRKTVEWHKSLKR